MIFFIFFLLTIIFETVRLESSQEINLVKKSLIQAETTAYAQILSELPEPIRKIIALYAAEWIHYRTIDKWFDSCIGESPHLAFNDNKQTMTLIRHPQSIATYNIEQNKIIQTINLLVRPNSASFNLSSNGHYYLVPPQYDKQSKQKKYSLICPLDERKVRTGEAATESSTSAISNDGKKFAFAHQKIWICDRSASWKSFGSDGLVTALQFSHDGNYIAAKISQGEDNSKILLIDCVHNTFTEHDLGEWSHQEITDCRFFFTKDNSYLALIGYGSDSGKIYFISLDKKKLAYTFDTGYQEIKWIDFSDKNQFLITANCNEAALWIQQEALSWRKIQIIYSSREVAIRQVALSPEATYCAVGTSYERLYIYKLFHGLNQNWHDDHKKEKIEELFRRIEKKLHTVRFLDQPEYI